ncbi:13441_t:CDS:10 [Funneliformis geosporum]|uniref:11738_t:CDS:1 n=1 Tax=Funneliformis geosporum TaxID=1117311 RepID=A0A9W4SHK5_9GLOM|nr:11738_t:CDS:10 [Funneliformis geosporum]CAI2172524.1 13441_t:CDS:10 [Funneliformis geosporum]
MDYKVPTHAEIDEYFSNNLVSEWHLLNVYMNSKLESSPLLTAPELFRSICKLLSLIETNEKNSYPKYVSEYAKKLRIAVKKIVERAERQELMRENENEIQQKQSKALDKITNAIVGKTGKRKRDSNDDDENKTDNNRISKNGKIEPMVQENYEEIATSEKGHSNGFEISSFGIEVGSKQISTWDYVISKMEIREDSSKDWINEGHNFSEDFQQFQKLIIEKLKTDPTLSYATDVESIIALTSIMILRKNKKPAYVLCTDNEWRMAFPQINYKFKIPALVQVTVCSYTQPLMRNDLAEFEELWRLNWSKVSLLENQEDKRIFDLMQIITRNFFYNLPYGKKKNLSNEDTYVHKTCHAILEEIFPCRNPTTCMMKVRFYSMKLSPQKWKIMSIVNQALAKLAILMKDALDIGIYDETYGVLINGNRIEFWRITLHYDGLYQLVSLVEMTFPTKVAEFLVILSVMERCYKLKELVLETEQRNMRKSNFKLNENFQRGSNSSSMKTKVPIIIIQKSQK